MTDSSDFRPVAAERTGWRDTGISDWHRKCGFNCPAIDLDAVVTESDIAEEMWVEYDYEQPKAMIDYKFRPSGGEIKLNGSWFRTQRNVANKLEVGFYVVGYDEDRHHFTLISANKFAADEIRRMANKIGDNSWQVKPSYSMNEMQFVNFLYKLRGRELPENIKANLYGGV